MQKVLQFLERNCQWFAIGLGVLFLAYMVYLYTPISPTPALAVNIAGKQVLPGQIEATIDGKATELDHEMSKNDVGFKIPAPPVLSAWQRSSALAEVDVKSLPNPFYFPGTTTNLGPQNNGEPSAGAKVKQLPTPPAAAPAVPVAADVVRTVADVIPPQPANPAGQPGAPPANPPEGVPTDVDVVSVLFTIDHKALADAFTKAFGNLTNLPPNIQQQIDETMVLSVDLIRQEQQPDGSWGPDT
ncbi:MAG TPA: hypothetical protein VHY37_01365, partial [Tepidisphaeraceae bacterium]|nr:hypothetical protein [Tepidisphaeraceae bacterium]